MAKTDILEYMRYLEQIINLLGSKNIEEKILSSDIDFNGDRVIISGETGIYSFQITEFGVPIEIGSKLELNCMSTCLNTE